MRAWGVAIVILAEGCNQQAKQPAAPPASVAFDGATLSGAAPRRALGERLTHVLGCTGCHGARLEGEQFEPSETQYGPIYGSNLTVEVPEYSNAQLDRIIRHGEHPERGSVWVMPSDIFQHLADPDFVALVAYLRSLKPIGTKLPPPRFSAQDKKDIASGQYKPASKLVIETAGKLPADLGPRYALGRYITEVTCAECHGTRLEGGPKNMPPDLVVAAGYSRAEFERLMTQGIPTGNRKLNLMMAGVARTRFAYLTPHERDALYAYLKARADRPQ